MAGGHDMPQRDIGGGIWGESGVRRSHAAPTVTAGNGRATAKNDSLMKVLLQHGYAPCRPVRAISLAGLMVSACGSRVFPVAAGGRAALEFIP